MRVARDPFTGGPGLTEAEREKKQRDDEEARRKWRERAEIEVRDVSGIHVTDDTRQTRTRINERAAAPPVGRYCGYLVTGDGQALAIIEDPATGRGCAVRVGEEYAALRVKAITTDCLLLEDRSGNPYTLTLSDAYADPGVVWEAPNSRLLPPTH
ncbi:MAG: hypothetical protein BWY76_03486 [bacterium ADurb.Bin429]|nr:MAG: hypothetical protein BWY76_03486 [bacterium ADurb.Bin429]